MSKEEKSQNCLQKKTIPFDNKLVEKFVMKSKLCLSDQLSPTEG